MHEKIAECLASDFLGLGIKEVCVPQPTNGGMYF
jgi:hypothetical protein